jgi:hypothetical protein
MNFRAFNKWIDEEVSVCLRRRVRTLHANALVGGNKIMLNPVSFGDANGINVAATLTDLQLVYVGSGGRRYDQPSYGFSLSNLAG